MNDQLSEEQLERLESLKKDMKFQLTFEHIDWDYFQGYVNEARIIEENRDG